MQSQQYDVVRHRDMQTVHLIKRFRERFGINVNYATLREFHRQIQSGNAKMIKDQILNKVYEVSYMHPSKKKPIKLWLVFDMLTDQICTVLDPNKHGVRFLNFNNETLLKNWNIQ